ncbi:hypothetical protein ES705_26900 [subsurface metagenome]
MRTRGRGVEDTYIIEHPFLKCQASAGPALSGPPHGGVGWQAAEAKKVGGKQRVWNEVDQVEMERERGPFFRPDRWGGGVRGRHIPPPRPLQPPPGTILGAWGGLKAEGKQQI